MFLNIIQAAIGSGAGMLGCEKAPAKLKEIHPSWPWDEDVIECTSSRQAKEAVSPVLASCAKLASRVRDTIKKGAFPIVLGGDHSCAIGTWHGVKEGLQEDFGLIWLDAHMDCHSVKSSPSGNIHGMPVHFLTNPEAVLEGHTQANIDPILSKASLKTDNIAYIGIRSYEQPELDFVTRNGMQVSYDTDRHTKTFKELLEQAIAHVTRNCRYFGITLDMDFFSPEDIMAVGTPEIGGFGFEEVYPTLVNMDVSRLVALEFVEYNPSLDNAMGQTGKSVARIMQLFIDKLGSR